LGQLLKLVDYYLKFPPKLKLNNHHNTNGQQKRKKIHILLAEDNKLSQIIFKNLIEGKCGFKLTIVGNGEDAMEKWKSDSTISLIFMDLQMPVKNGFDTTKEIRQIEKQNPAKKQISIIALTASTISTEIDGAINCGMDECLSKPSTKMILEDVIWRHLNAQNNRIF